MRRLPTFQVGDWQVQSWISDRDALRISRFLGGATDTSTGAVELRDFASLVKSPALLVWSMARMSADAQSLPLNAARLSAWFHQHGIRCLLDDALQASPAWREGADPESPVDDATFEHAISWAASQTQRNLADKGSREQQDFARAIAIGQRALVVIDARGQAVSWLQWVRDWNTDLVDAIELVEAEVSAEVQEILNQERLMDSVANPFAEFAAGFENRLYRWAQLVKVERDFVAELERAKLSAMKELAYGASHEINNPLANISTRAQTLLREETHPERRQKLAMINAQAFRAHEMISNMMLFAHPPDLQTERVSWQAILDQVMTELRADADQQQTSLHVGPAEFDSEAAITELSADPTHLAVLLKALVRNSFEALGSGGRVELRCRRDAAVPVLGSDRVVAGIRLEVIDDGPGIAADVREHLFDPFYSGREAGRGLGFGLSKAWRIVEMHRGTLSVSSWGGDALPSTGQGESRAQESSFETPPDLRRGTVFVVQLPLPCDSVEST